MSGIVEYYFAPVSGEAYLCHAALHRIAAARGAVVSHRPFDIAAVDEAMCRDASAATRPSAVGYRHADLQRWAGARGLGINLSPKHWPQSCDIAARAIIAAERLGDNVRFAEAVLAALWWRDLDICDAATLSQLCAECGLPAADVMREADSEAVRAQYAGNTAEAVRRGVFGSPTFFVGSDQFFGQDRLHFVDAALMDPPQA